MARQPPPLLFDSGELWDVLNARKREAAQAVADLPQRQFIAASDDDLIEHVYLRFAVDPLELDRTRATADTGESVVDALDYPHAYVTDGRRVDVPAHTVTIYVPFKGNAELWDLRPNFFTSNPPRATVGSGRIHFVSTFPAGQEPDLKAFLDRQINNIDEYLRHQKTLIADYNRDVLAIIKNAIQQRRARLSEKESIVAKLGLPLEKRAGAPDYAAIPVHRAIKPLPPAPPPGAPEPALTAQQYDDILSIIRHQGRTFEATASSFSALEEEQLRDLLLAALNTIYKGNATGETFRSQGKTDIRIEANNRSAFVAECKVWRGASGLIEGIDQLLGYLTWRDGKAAVVVFNKQTKDRALVIKEIDQTFRPHPAFRSAAATGEDGEWRYTLRSKADATKDVVCHVFLFHMHSEAAVPKASGKPKRTRKPKKS